MKNFSIILAFIVAKCLLQVHGFPGAEESVEEEFIEDGSLSSGVEYGTQLASKEVVSGFGPGTQYTIDSLKKALSSNTAQSLSKTLNLNIFSKWFKKADAMNFLTQFIIGQAKGDINFETAMVLAEAIGDIAAETSAALKTITYIIMKVKQGEGTVNQGLIEPALNAFYGSDHIDSDNTKAWMKLAPFISKAAQGDTDAARKVLNALASANADLRAVKNGDGSTVHTLLKAVIEKAVSYPNTLQGR